MIIKHEISFYPIDDMELRKDGLYYEVKSRGDILGEYIQLDPPSENPFTGEVTLGKYEGEHRTTIWNLLGNEKGKLIKGKKDGEWIEHYGYYGMHAYGHDKRIEHKTIVNYKNGKRIDHIVIDYHTDKVIRKGHITSYGYCTLEYYETGKLKSEQQLNKNNSSRVLNYYYYGPLQSEVVADEKGGLISRKNYYDNGQIEHEFPKKIEEGYKIIKYHKNGQVLEKTKIDKNIREHILYHENGQLESNVHYNLEKNKDGEKEGEILSYHDNGSLKSKLNYKGDKQEGDQIAYYADGQLKYKENYINGKLYGECLVFYANGQLKRKCSYVNGKRDGKYMFFMDDGMLKETETYENGELVNLHHKIKKILPSWW
jgi:antitoxin component YwqK of YwqJK toxin-antitoxin module